MGDLIANEVKDENALINSINTVIECTEINSDSLIKEGAIDMDFLFKSLEDRGIVENQDVQSLLSSLLHKKESKK